LDISIIPWEKQKPESIQKLRDALVAEFEYVDNHMSLRGFRNAIKRFLKMERSRLKTKYVGGQTDCPIYIQPQQREALKSYWGTSSQLEKADQMANARKHIKNMSSVWWKWKAGKEAMLVRDGKPLI
jgi:hypothetical protein